MEVFTLRKTGVKNNFPLESWLFPLPKRRKWNEKQSEGENFRWRLGSSLTRRFCAWDATQNSQYNSICPPGRFTFLLLFKNGKTHQNVKAVSFPAARLKAESPCPAVIVVVDRTPPPCLPPEILLQLKWPRGFDADKWPCFPRCISGVLCFGAAKSSCRNSRTHQFA